MAKKGNNLTLRAAKRKGNDEFYTRLEDIQNELRVYGLKCRHFEGKTVLCPCDESEHTNFGKHFTMNFEEYGLKRLVCIGYRTNRPAEVHILERTQDGIIEKNITLKGNGDFRNEETQKWFDESDVIVTNPPFTLFREFIDTLMAKNKKFIVLGNQNAITYKEVFPLIKDNKLWFGYGFNKVMEFKVVDGYNYTRVVIENGKEVKLGKVPAISWFTNLEIPKRKEILDTNIDFEFGNSKGWYEKYDNFDAINVNRTNQIPMDYDGLMGVPITFMDKYNPDQFEIIGLFNGYAQCDWDNGFICGNKTEYIDKGKSKFTTGPVIDKSAVYARILIKKKN